MFNNSSQFVVSGGTFNNSNHYHSNPESGLGLGKLYKASMPDAALDSSAREYAAKCYPGTREQRIQQFISWASAFIARRDRRFCMMWMSGPAGVGKSALAQTCAEKLGKERMGAAFFFSRFNRRDDPNRLIPTIAYQIAMVFEQVARILDTKIRKDPSLLSKTIEVQFRELVVLPLLQVKMQDKGVHDRLVIIDGLDECSGDNAQRVVVETIATAMRRYGDDLPLLWALFSRPEPHIVRTFTSTDVSPLCLSTTLPISETTNKEMELYLRGGFDEIRKQRPYLPPSWPSEDDFSALVERSNGFFAYASTATKFIGDPEALDPEERLRIVLALYSKPRSRTGDHPNPMADLDMLYTLLMQQIPKDIRPFTLAIFLLLRLTQQRHYQTSFDTEVATSVPVLASYVGLSFQSFGAALSKLHSVLRLNFRHETPWQVIFEHASFMEFLDNSKRCGSDFWIKHPRQYGLLTARSLEQLVEFLEVKGHSPQTSLDEFLEQMKLSAPADDMEKTKLAVRHRVFRNYQLAFPKWLILANIDDSLAAQLTGFDFKAWWDYDIGQFDEVSQLEALISKVPLNYREQIIRPRRHAEPAFISWLKDRMLPKQWRSGPIYILGQGKKSLLLKVGQGGRVTHIHR